MSKQNLGNVEIRPQALAVIVSIATKEVEGVSKMIGNFTTNALEKIGKKEYIKGVRLSFDEKDVNVDITCTIKSSQQLPIIAREIQKNVRSSIYNMTELNVKTINVNIVGIDY